jgi:O-antigen/teichoic acid export membrane protein
VTQSLGASLSRNAAWNIVGLSLPVVVLLFAVPVLIENLGTERFGLLAILWAVVGYAGLFDLGLSRALTHSVARHATTGGQSHVAVAANGVACLACLGVLFSVMLWIFTDAIVGAIDVSPVLRDELTTALAIGELILPLVLLNAGLLGVLEALNRFDVSNVCRVVVATIAVGGAAVVSLWTHELWMAMLCLGISRIAAVCLATWRLGRTEMRAASARMISRSGMCGFVKSARWLAASNLMGMALAYGDRLILLFAASAATLAWYVTPYEVVTKLLVVATSVGSAVFPAFSASANDRDASRKLFLRAVCLIALFLLPIAVACAVLAKPGLTIWIDSDFAANSAGIAQILCIGVICNAFATVPFAYLQAVGRARAVAGIHAVETPLYVIVLLWAAGVGVEGVALAWAGRMLLDLLLLSSFAAGSLRSPKVRGVAV